MTKDIEQVAKELSHKFTTVVMGDGQEEVITDWIGIARQVRIANLYGQLDATLKIQRALVVNKSGHFEFTENMDKSINKQLSEAEKEPKA